MDSVTQLGDWKKISVLGSGAFGVVVLLKNEVTAEFVGKFIYLRQKINK